VPSGVPVSGRVVVEEVVDAIADQIDDDHR
jgi:hypothetical protein